MPALRTDTSIDVSKYGGMLDAAMGHGGPTVAAGGAGDPVINVRMPGVGAAGSANAAEQRLRTGAGPGPGRVSMSVPAATAAFWGWTDAEQKALAKKAWYLGLVSSPDDVEGAFTAWQWAVGRAGDYAMAGRDMDPQDVMELLAAGSPDAAKQREANMRRGETVTQKQRSISLTDPVQARSMIEQAFQQSMGRDPTDAEYRTLLNSLHSAQRSNPVVTQQTTKFDNQGNPLPDQSSITSGGVDAGAFVAQAAQDNPEAAEFQAATGLFPALMRALSSPLG